MNQTQKNLVTLLALTVVAGGLGLYAWLGVIPTERLPDRLCKPVATNWVGPWRHVVQYPLRNFRLMNLVGVVEGRDWQVESWTARGSHAEMHADFAGWHPDIHAMIDAIETPFRWAFLARDPLPAWGRGRVSLLGDFRTLRVNYQCDDGDVRYQLVQQLQLLGPQFSIEPAHSCYVPARLTQASDETN